MRILFTLTTVALFAVACTEGSPAPQTEAVEQPVVEQPKEITPVSYELAIEGMTCEHCAARVKSILEEQPGVESAEVSHEAGSAKVAVKAGAALDEDSVRQALDKDMYKLTACAVSS